MQPLNSCSIWQMKVEWKHPIKHLTDILQERMLQKKVVPDTDPAKEMYSQYAEECNVQGRPLVAQTMEFISDMGTIFQSCMKDEITVDEFCEKAQELVETYQ